MFSITLLLTTESKLNSYNPTKNQWEEGKAKFRENLWKVLNRWNEWMQMCSSPLPPQPIAACQRGCRKAICFQKTGAERTWQPGEECCQSNFWTSTAELSSAERPTTVHPAAPPSVIPAFSSRAWLGPKQSLPYHWRKRQAALYNAVL